MTSVVKINPAYIWDVDVAGDVAWDVDVEWDVAYGEARATRKITSTKFEETVVFHNVYYVVFPELKLCCQMRKLSRCLTS